MNILLTTCNASYIHKNLALRWLYVMRPPGFSVRIAEFTINDKPERILKEIQGKWDVIAFSVYIWNGEITKQLIRGLRNFDQCPTIVVGGPEVIYTASLWLDIGADIVIRGEGEEAFWQAVQGDLMFDGVCTRNQLSAVCAVTDLSKLQAAESPYFLPMDLPMMDKQYLYVESSRGCAFDCTYCLSSVEKGLRTFDLEYMMQLIADIEKSNVRQVKFLDRTFNLFSQRALAIAKALNQIRRDVIVQFECEVTSLSAELEDFFAKEADKQRFRFEIGVQSFYPPTLQAVRRLQNNAQVKRIIDRWVKAQLTVHADLIAGLPEEGLSQFKESFIQLFRLAPAEIQVGTLKLLPGTLMSVQAKATHYRFYPIAPYTVIETPWCSQDDIYDIQALALCTDKTYNLPRAKTCWQLLDHLGYDVASLMIDCGKKLKILTHPYQQKDVIDCVISTVEGLVDRKWIEAAVMTDIAKLSRVTPQRWFDFVCPTEIRLKILRFAAEKYQVPYDLMRRKGWLHTAIYKNRLCIQCWLFTPDHHGNYGYYTYQGDPL